MKILQLILYICTVPTSEGFALRKSRILAGRNCDSQEYPYLAPIADGGLPACEGSFVTPGWVLTAAGCCTKMTTTLALIVVAGQSRWMIDEQEYARVEAVYPHKQYNKFLISSDICLVKLKKHVTPSARVKISKLATTADYEGFIKNGKCNKSLIMGFDEPTENATNLDPHLKCANLPVLPPFECIEHPVTSTTIGNDVFCMKHPFQKLIGSCQDEGGPVYCENLQIGVASVGAGCSNEVRFYIRVDQFKDYIERQIQMEEEKSSAVRSKGFFKVLMIFPVIINIVAILRTNILNT